MGIIRLVDATGRVVLTERATAASSQRLHDFARARHGLLTDLGAVRLVVGGRDLFNLIGPCAPRAPTLAARSFCRFTAQASRASSGHGSVLVHNPRRPAWQKIYGSLSRKRRFHGTRLRR